MTGERVDPVVPAAMRRMVRACDPKPTDPEPVLFRGLLPFLLATVDPQEFPRA